MPIDPSVLARRTSRTQSIIDGGTMLSSFMDNPNSKGRVSIGGQMASKAAAGAQMGMAAGPWGAAAGAVIGGAMGLISGKADKQKAEDDAKLQARVQLQNQQQQGANFAAMNPEEVYGNKNASYFKLGGTLKSFNGAGTQLSSNTVALDGPSHEEGGIDLGDGNEAEGGETVTNQPDGTYVMTNLLGIANAHKSISKQIGKIEKKTMSPERVNSLKLLRNKEQRLINLQQQLNGNK
jgi:hypothetical protein